jgi:hypothetical protein
MTELSENNRRVPEMIRYPGPGQPSLQRRSERPKETKRLIARLAQIVMLVSQNVS